MALLAAYNFDELSGDVIDHAGTNDWTLNTGAQRTTGDSGHTDEGLTKLGAGLATVASPAFGQTSARTFMFWMKGAGNAVWWLRFYITGDDTGSWGLYLLGGNLTLRLRKGGANTNTAVAWTDDGLWHHYAGTYDGSNARLYKDGTLVATSAAVTAPLDSADSIQVLETSLTTQTMDDLRIYDEALDQATIATLKDTPVGAVPSASGSVTLSVAADVGPTGARSAPGSVGLAAGAALATTGARGAAGGVPLPASSALTPAGVRLSPGVLGAGAAAGLIPSGQSMRAGSVTLSASAVLIATEAGPVQPPGSWRIGWAPHAGWSAGRTPRAVWRCGT